MTISLHLGSEITYLLGQACMDMVVNPPRPGDPSYSMWKTEVDDCLASLKRSDPIL